MYKIEKEKCWGGPGHTMHGSCHDNAVIYKFMMRGSFSADWALCKNAIYIETYSMITNIFDNIREIN